MDFGKVEYVISEPGDGGKPRSLRLTLIGQGDEETLKREGLAGLRRKRVVRLTKEAEYQGYKLSYEELSSILLTSLATLKRDVQVLEEDGEEVVLKGRRKNGNGDQR